MKKTYKSEFRNIQEAFVALSAKDAMVYCENINMPYEDYHENILQEIKIKEMPMGENGYNKALVTVTQNI